MAVRHHRTAAALAGRVWTDFAPVDFGAETRWDLRLSCNGSGTQKWNIEARCRLPTVRLMDNRVRLINGLLESNGRHAFFPSTGALTRLPTGGLLDNLRGQPPGARSLGYSFGPRRAPGDSPAVYRCFGASVGFVLCGQRPPTLTRNNLPTLWWSSATTLFFCLSTKYSFGWED
jgi:hypothetical protein